MRCSWELRPRRSGIPAPLPLARSPGKPIVWTRESPASTGVSRRPPP